MQNLISPPAIVKALVPAAALVVPAADPIGDMIRNIFASYDAPTQSIRFDAEPTDADYDRMAAEHGEF